MADWNAAQYLKFETERTQPAIDLARRIPQTSPRRILDVGCGPGNSSAVLAATFPGASILGIDAAPEMVEAARQAHPDMAFAVCDAATDLDSLEAGFDVVFSNACIQWIPDHQRLLATMLRLVAPGGALAVQVPMQMHEPIHEIIDDVANSDKWQAKCGDLDLFHTLQPGRYFDILTRLTPHVTLWETTYYHVLTAHTDIVEWYRGTGLRPYLAALSPSEGDAFAWDVLEQVVRRYPAQAGGEIIFRFPRFFFIATAP